jgi:hypothetical protein
MIFIAEVCDIRNENDTVTYYELWNYLCHNIHVDNNSTGRVTRGQQTRCTVSFHFGTLLSFCRPSVYAYVI